MDHEPTPGTDPTSPDGTLGGYFRVHDRPPAFDGPDGHPYTVSVEVEKTANLRAPYSGYLVFPRWAQTGVGIVGHAETPTLCECRTEEEAIAHLGELTLLEVQSLLHGALASTAADADQAAADADLRAAADAGPVNGVSGTAPEGDESAHDERGHGGH